MDIIGPQLNGVQFTMFSADEIRKASVMEIVTSLEFNALGHPLPGGPYDIRMGPTGNIISNCETCLATERNCPGHFGRIELPLPVINPLFHPALYAILRMACLSCHRLLLAARVKPLLIAQLELLDQGHIVEAQQVSEVVAGLDFEGTAAEVVELLVKDEVAVFLAKVRSETTSTGCRDTSLVQAIRMQIINDAFKHQIGGKKCVYCKSPIKPITMYKSRLMTTISKVEVADKFKDDPSATKSSKSTRGSCYLLPTEVKQNMRDIWQNEHSLLTSLYPILKNTSAEYPTDLFFLEVLPVTPPKVRPVGMLRGVMVGSTVTNLYKAIIDKCILIQAIRRMMDDNLAGAESKSTKALVEAQKGDTLVDKMRTVWNDLQSAVDHVLDANLSPTFESKQLQGLKQTLEKKEGMLRKHMMGKRVNYAARSVITPDPNLNVEEIGLPEAFAMKLTYPERYNGNNFYELKQIIINGPDTYPGANFVETRNGKIIRLGGGEENRRNRISVAKQLLHSGDDADPSKLGEKIVHRHLVNGDVLLLNRQPTLHRPSIMAHRARILKGEKTIRMHYSNCKAYNADFDGDEMNAHCPQSEVARSEGMHIVNVQNQYLVPKDGTPLGGLIQDHVIGSVHLTVRGQLLSKQDYQQLVFQALSHVQGDIVLVPPCILKPKKLWSGKQVISTILLNIIPKGKKPISMVSTSKTSLKSWQKFPPRPWNGGGEPFSDPNAMSEHEVIFHQGHFVSGILDKQHFGATQYSLTHGLYELYGGECSSKFLNSLGKLFTYYLQLIGFTLGVEDILVLPEPDKKRKKIIKKARKIGDLAAARALELDNIPPDLLERLEMAYYQDRTYFRAKLDSEYKKALDEYTNKINKVCLPDGLIAKFPKNNLQLMVVAGAKGSTVNTMQISCLLGQIELEGKRPPLMVSGRSLPSFRPFETAPRAGGFIDGRFMTGILPQDFFFHCMAGREGLIDTAVKTSRSGYLQRCLIKHLEGLTVCYDHTVRNYDGTVVQFAYGEDGMEVSKAVFFKPSQMDFLFRNRYAILHKPTLSALKDKEVLKKIANHKQSIVEWKKQHARERLFNKFTKFTASIRDLIPEKKHNAIEPSTGRPKAYRKYLKKWRRLSEEDKNKYNSEACPDPVTSNFSSHRDFGAISEALEQLLEDYLRSRPLMTANKKANMHNLIAFKSMTALCDPGEAVGLLAAQSIGEPSTQMTLNTFHFAGRGEMNVTLGIPRLREILMTASQNIKTPSMEIPLLPNSKAEKHAERLVRTLRRVTLADVLEKVHVVERLVTEPSCLFTYTIRFNFLPHKCYRKKLSVTPQLVLKHVEKDFLILLSKVIRPLGKRYGVLIQESLEEKRASNLDKDDDEEGVDEVEPELPEKKMNDVSDSSDDEEDAGAAKRKTKRLEEREYDEETDASDGPSDSEEEDDGEKIIVDEKVPEEVIQVLTKKAENRIAYVLNTFNIVRSYRYDVDLEEWCEVVIGLPLSLSKINFFSILRETCEKSVIYEVPGIRRAIVCKTNRGGLAIKTEGINIVEMSRFEKVLNLRQLYCNAPHTMADTYGIEAAGRVIVKELQTVFQVYGITVDPRHLLLIADYMTVQGIYLPFSRYGLAAGSSSFQQLTFESAISFLKRSIFNGRYESLESPSARIMVGRPCKCGTGSFDLRPSPKIALKV